MDECRLDGCKLDEYRLDEIKENGYDKIIIMLKLFNSYTRELEDFKPIKGKTVTMYNCGPTVYDFAHIGNLRSYLFADVLRRWLEYRGYKVKQVMNITDVGHALGDVDVGGDKIEEGAKREGLSPQEVARKFEARFINDIKLLNIEPAWKYPRASEHVTDMVAMIAKLLKNNFAYEAEGDVYFDISMFPNYGKLSGNTIASLEAGSRVEVNPKKKHPNDFALWIHNPKHLMQWDAPWSRGYPGWHIECSAMSNKYLGETIDIHTGGEDNKFPHHECEVAQSESVTGKPLAHYWLHTSHLMVDGAKMSKSLNNFYRLDDLVAKGFEPRVIRYSLIASHYREHQNFTLESLSSSVGAIKKLDGLWTRLNGKIGPAKKLPVDKKMNAKQIIETLKLGFGEAMDDDLNVSKALGALFAFVHEMNSALDEGIGRIERAVAKKTLRAITDKVLGIKLKIEAPAAIPPEFEDLLRRREKARKEKDFVTADALRNELFKKGFYIKDGPSGPKLEKI